MGKQNIHYSSNTGNIMDNNNMGSIDTNTSTMASYTRTMDAPLTTTTSRSHHSSPSRHRDHLIGGRLLEFNKEEENSGAMRAPKPLQFLTPKARYDSRSRELFRNNAIPQSARRASEHDTLSFLLHLFLAKTTCFLIDFRWKMH